jgi:ribosomal protein S13
MKIDLFRKYIRNGYSIGKLSINGKTICDTLEDEDRGLISEMTEEEIKSIKLYGKTAIPVGEYKVTMSYSQRFKKVMPLLLDVKGFAGIRIHSGNTAEDTEGCILCGLNSEKGKVLNSKVYTELVYKYIRNGLNEGVTIQIHW